MIADSDFIETKKRFQLQPDIHSLLEIRLKRFNRNKKDNKMKASISIISMVIALSVLLVGSVSASVPQVEVARVVSQHAGNNNNIFTIVRGRTVVITGNFDTPLDRSVVIGKAKSVAGISRVIDHTRVTSN